MSSEIKQKSTASIIIEGIFIAITMTFLAISAMPNFCKKNPYYNQKICFSNQRCLMGAIEMYNMDSNTMISTFNPNIYDTLLRGKYLQEELETECEFFVEGDLTEDGYIYCSNHGAYGGQKEGKNIEKSANPKAKKRKEITQGLIFLALCFGPTLIFYFFSFI